MSTLPFARCALSQIRAHTQNRTLSILSAYFLARVVKKLLFPSHLLVQGSYCTVVVVGQQKTTRKEQHEEGEIMVYRLQYIPQSRTRLQISNNTPAQAKRLATYWGCRHEQALNIILSLSAGTCIASSSPACLQVFHTGRKPLARVLGGEPHPRHITPKYYPRPPA